MLGLCRTLHRSETVPALWGGLPDEDRGEDARPGEQRPQRQRGGATYARPHPSNEHPRQFRGGGGWGGAGGKAVGGGSRWSRATDRTVPPSRCALSAIRKGFCPDDSRGSVESILLFSIQLSSSLLAADQQSSAL